MALMLSILTLNVNGMRDSSKRHRIFQFCKSLNVDFVFLQESHITCLDDANIWSIEWGGGLYASYGSSSKCGTIILTAPHLTHQVGKVNPDHEGRLLSIIYKHSLGNICLCNVYAPNNPSDRKDFFNVLPTFIPGNMPCLLAGDFNCVPDPGLDRRNPGSHRNSRAGIFELGHTLELHSLSDIWRTLNPSTYAFTWHKPDGSDASRLDRIYGPSDYEVRHCSITQCPLSDHDAVKVCFKLPASFPTGRGFWKLNVEVLKEVNFQRELRQCYEGWCSLKPAFSSLIEWWDEIKSRIKQFCIKYCVARARRQREEFLSLCTRVRDGSNSALNALQRHLDNKFQGARIRARAESIESEERPCAKFYTAANKVVLGRRVNGVRSPDGSVSSSTDDILRVYRDFYSSLYTASEVDETLHDGLLDAMTRSPTDAQNDALGAPLSVKELYEALSKMKNGKSPGSDGLPKEFYISFWNMLGTDLGDVFDGALSSGRLADSHRHGVITLLPKSGDPLDPTNKRPITLLNVDYKILAKTMANRLAFVMPDLVNPFQTCAVRGQTIFRNLWLIRDLVDFVINRDLPCALLSLDQKKAFDMVDHGFLFKVLVKLGINPVFVGWIRTLYMDVSSCVIVNGFLSDPFRVTRGVRQGCPLSALLYVLFSESLSQTLAVDSTFSGFHLPCNLRVKCVQYADDVTCVVSDFASFRALAKVLSAFERATGAELNPKKSVGLRLGKWRYRCLPFDAKWVDTNIRINGIWFGYDNPDNLTWSERFSKFETSLRRFAERSLTLLGKITVLNRFVFPSLWYPGTVYPVPSHFVKRLEKTTFGFVWSEKTELVRRIVLYGTLDEGGLGLIHVPSKLRFLLVRQVLDAVLHPELPHSYLLRFWGGMRLRSYFRSLFNNSEPHSESRSKAYCQIVESLDVAAGGRREITVTRSFPSDTYTSLLRRFVPAPVVQHHLSVWRLVHCRLCDGRLRDLSWRIVHGALVTNLKRYHWRLGDGRCPRQGCSGMEGVPHIFWQCAFVSFLWEWFQGLVDRVVGRAAWSVSMTFVLHGLSPPVCTPQIVNILWLVCARVRRRIWLSRCDLVFRDVALRSEEVLRLIKSDIRLQVRTDFARLRKSTFRRRWCAVGSFVQLRDDGPCINL